MSDDIPAELVATARIVRAVTDAVLVQVGGRLDELEALVCSVERELTKRIDETHARALKALTHEVGRRNST